LFTFRDGLIAYEQRIYDFGGLLERLEKVRLDHELRTAATLQQMLMAHTDLVGDFFEVARVSIPCRAIGGDFLEYHHIPRVSLGLALGDVSGKGAPAALVAAMLHGMLAMAADGFSAPDTLLHRLNEALRRRELAERYATLCYAVLSFDGRLTYANAGHPPPLLVTGPRVEPLTAGGPILGVFESSQFPSDTVTLAPGDSVVFYSDGLTEAVSPTGEEFGIERVMTEIAEHAHAKPAALVTRLLTTLQQFASTATSVDDATIAVLTYRPGRGELASY
jgi:sigma-B regulation protein RsbU (phosphoserine phosphatase)